MMLGGGALVLTEDVVEEVAEELTSTPMPTEEVVEVVESTVSSTFQVFGLDWWYILIAIVGILVLYWLYRKLR